MLRSSPFRNIHRRARTQIHTYSVLHPAWFCCCTPVSICYKHFPFIRMWVISHLSVCVRWQKQRRWLTVTYPHIYVTQLIYFDYAYEVYRVFVSPTRHGFEFQSNSLTKSETRFYTHTHSLCLWNVCLQICVTEFMCEYVTNLQLTMREI